MPLLAKRFSITNFFIATTALGFQVFVLYPWHNKLDADFTELKKENESHHTMQLDFNNDTLPFWNNRPESSPFGGQALD
ncbi:hypothetical protein BST61_g1463 [Cercospora zeina]